MDFVAVSKARLAAFSIALLVCVCYVLKILFHQERIEAEVAIFQYFQRPFVFSSVASSSDIFILDQTGHASRLTNASEADSNPSCSPDGRWIAFETIAGVYIMPRSGGERQFVSVGMEPQWHPDGRLSFYRVGPDGGGIYFMTPTGLAAGPLPGTEHAAYFSWSPDGTQVVIMKDFEGQNQLYLLSFEGQQLAQLTTGGSNSDPRWSPDGELIAFSSNRDGNWDIYTMRPEGSEQKRLTVTPEDGLTYAAEWTPDSLQLVFESDRDRIGENMLGIDSPTQETYVMRRDGTQQTRLTFGGGVMPRWC